MATCIFDAYGTLLDVNGAARIAAAEPGGAVLAQVWPGLSANWRRKQLEYTWLRTCAGKHADFEQVTAEALDWAMAAAGIADDVLRARLMALYRTLPPFPEAKALLATLRKRGVTTGILSNGTPAMLDAAITAAGLAESFDAVLSVEAVGSFKPYPTVYDLVCARFGGTPSDVLFVSSNGWDAAAAAGYGFRTVWVNRTGDPVDRLWATPDLILSDLTGVAGLI
jgi:2-haloacid dehalogenase